MDRRQAYEAELLATFARLGSGARTGATAERPGLSDADRDNEWRAQNNFFAALEIFRRAVHAAAALTSLRKDALDELLTRLDDAIPDTLAWDEAIAEARRY